MRASRLLSILILLQLRGRMSAEALAEEFEVSARTILRDIDQLSAAGAPIYAERGRNGGFRLDESYRTELTGLSRAEADALAFAGVPHAAGDLGLGGALAAARLKLFAALPAETGASAEKVSAKFHVDPVDWYRRAAPPAALPQLADALWRERKIRIRYESWKGEVWRALSPIGLVLKAGIWYLVAGDAKGARVYRVDNVRDLEILEAQAAPAPRHFRLDRFWRDWTHEFEARLKKGTATLRVSPEGMKRLALLGAHVAEAAEASAAPDGRSGWRRVEIPIEGVEHAARDLIRLGAEAEILSPPGLRQRFTEELTRIARLYR